MELVTINVDRRLVEMFRRLNEELSELLTDEETLSHNFRRAVDTAQIMREDLGKLRARLEKVEVLLATDAIRGDELLDALSDVSPDHDMLRKWPFRL